MFPPPPVLRRAVFGLLAIYFALLAVSHARVRRAAPREPPEQHAFYQAVPGVTADGLRAPAVRLSYFDSDPESPPNRPVIVLVHGSPGGKRDFGRLIAGLGDQLRVIAPDLPGFGESTLDVPDYSLRAHARYVLELTDALGVARFHVVGFSMGGGVVLNMSELAPERTASVTLLSAIGVQEMELFSDYSLNHVIHGAQIGLLWAIFNLVPHMGSLGDGRSAMGYALNFYESDQRPLRRILERVEVPLLILHGRHDPLVPVEAAVEHHRLVPQSELDLFDEDHSMTFFRGRDMASTIAAFVGRVEAGQALSRNLASADRLRAAVVPFDSADLPPLRGVAFAVFMFLLFVDSLGTPAISGAGAGIAVGLGRIGWLPPGLGLIVGTVVAVLPMWRGGTWRDCGRRVRSSVATGALAWTVGTLLAWAAASLGWSLGAWRLCAWALLVASGWIVAGVGATAVRQMWRVARS